MSFLFCCCRICRKSPELVYSSRLDGLEKNIRDLSALLLQRRNDHTQTKRTIFTYSTLILVPLLATLFALPPGVLLPASPLWRWAPLIALPLAFLAFYRLIDWLYTRRIQREAQQLEQMKADLQETIAEYKEKTNFAEMIRKMAGYEQAANASLFMPLAPAPTQVELFTPHKAGAARVAFTPAGGAAAASSLAPVTPRASQAALTAAENRKAPATGTRRSLSATDLAQTPAHQMQQRAGSMGGIAENSGLSDNGAGANDGSGSSSSSVMGASLESLQHELQAARALANAAQRDAEAMRQHAHKSQTALQQLAALQMQGNAAHAGPSAQAAAMMVAGGLTATDVQQLKQGTASAPPPVRGLVDKMVDYVLGEGPNSRFALLCKHCYAHNGLVAPEERENTRYRCPHCGGLNGDFASLIKEFDSKKASSTGAAAAAPTASTAAASPAAAPLARQSSTSGGSETKKRL